MSPALLHPPYAKDSIGSYDLAWVIQDLQRLNAVAPGGSVWGSITGTLTDQADLVVYVAAQIAPKAPLASPALTGIPTAPTAVAGTNTTQLATTEFVTAALNATDITWANLLNAIGGSTLEPFRWYHVTTAPDGSTTIDEAWVRAKDANEIFPDGECLINAVNITARLARIKFFMAGGVGGKISGVYDGLQNVIEGNSVSSGGTVSTANIDAWLDFLSATNQNIKIYGSTLVGGDGTIGTGSTITNGGLDISEASTFHGVIYPGGSCTLAGGANANGAFIGFNGQLLLDNGTIMASVIVGAGKTLNVADGSAYVGFSTEGNTSQLIGAPNPSGDLVTIDATNGTVIIADGSGDVTISVPNGLFDGQQLTITFVQGSATINWAGATLDANFFPGSFGAPAKIHATWNATGSIWY